MWLLGIWMGMGEQRSLWERGLLGVLEQAVHDRQMSRKAKDRAALEQRIGYEFADKALLERALTHISALSGGAQNRAASYQRLEFLGDHVLGLAGPRLTHHPRQLLKADGALMDLLNSRAQILQELPAPKRVSRRDNEFIV